MKIFLRVLIGFVFGAYLGYLGFDVTTRQFWILVALFIGYDVIGDI